VSPNEILPTVLGIGLVAAAAAFALLPFVRGVPAETTPSEAPEAERFFLYRQVLELEFDHQVGKLSGEDYARQSEGLLAKAGEALRAERGSLGDIDAEIEREIAAARAAFAAARHSTSTSTTVGTPS
jgi:hypothetical protein